MNIQRVVIKDFKVLKDVDASLEGYNLLLMGDNGVGKTSFIQFIEIALGRQKNIPAEAQGEGMVITNHKGEEWVFFVRFKDGKPIVTVQSPQGLKDTRKSAIREVVGAVDFDVEEFVDFSRTESGRRKQVEIVKGYLPEDIQKELQKIENHVKACFEDRTELGRELKSLNERIKAHPLYDGRDLDKIEEINVEDLMDQIKDIQESNKKIEMVVQANQERRSSISRHRARREEIKAEINRLNQEDMELEALINEKDNVSTRADGWITVNPQKDTSSLEDQISQATRLNKEYLQAQELKNLLEKREQTDEQVGDLTARIDSERQLLQDTIRQMDALPIDGVSFNEDMLMWHDIPVHPDNLATSEIMELGIHLKIAENPDLPIFIQRGESLGSQRLQSILDFAERTGHQVIMEQVHRGEERLTLEIMAADGSPSGDQISLRGGDDA